VQALRRELRELGRRLDRRQPRADAFLEPDPLTQSVRHHQDVGEQDRRVQAKAPDRLQRRFDRQVRRETEVEKARRPRTQLAVFRQVAAGLAHEPDRRRR